MRLTSDETNGAGAVNERREIVTGTEFFSQPEVRGASDIDSLMAHSEDEDELKEQLKTPLITPTVDATPTKDHAKENGDSFQCSNIYGPMDSPIADQPGEGLR